MEYKIGGKIKVVDYEEFPAIFLATVNAVKEKLILAGNGNGKRIATFLFRVPFAEPVTTFDQVLVSVSGMGNAHHTQNAKDKIELLGQPNITFIPYLPIAPVDISAPTNPAIDQRDDSNRIMIFSRFLVFTTRGFNNAGVFNQDCKNTFHLTVAPQVAPAYHSLGLYILEFGIFFGN
jgi:hypothetical protein